MEEIFAIFILSPSPAPIKVLLHLNRIPSDAIVWTLVLVPGPQRMAKLVHYDTAQFSLCNCPVEELLLLEVHGASTARPIRGRRPHRQHDEHDGDVWWCGFARRDEFELDVGEGRPSGRVLLDGCNQSGLWIRVIEITPNFGVRIVDRKANRHPSSCGPMAPLSAYTRRAHCHMPHGAEGKSQHLDFGELPVWGGKEGQEEVGVKKKRRRRSARFKVDVAEFGKVVTLIYVQRIWLGEEGL